MKIFVITDADGMAEDRSLVVQASDAEQARQLWQAYYEIEDDDSGGTKPERIFQTYLALPYGFASKPRVLAWHSDEMLQVGGTLSQF